MKLLLGHRSHNEVSSTFEQCWWWNRRCWIYIDGNDLFIVIYWLWVTRDKKKLRIRRAVICIFKHSILYRKYVRRKAFVTRTGRQTDAGFTEDLSLASARTDDTNEIYFLRKWIILFSFLAYVHFIFT